MSELLNVAELAAILKVSPDTVVRRFAKVKGVVKLGADETRSKRRYRLLRIPKHVVEKYIGQPIDVVRLEPKSPKRQPRADWMSKTARHLAREIVNHVQDDPTDRGIFKKILADARSLTFVPEEEWGSVIFFEEDGDPE